MFHVRVLDVLRLKAVRGPIDIMVTHDWPRNITQHGDEAALLRFKSFLADDIRAARAGSGKFGSVPGAELLALHQPRYWFAAHMHCRFPALVRHPSGRETRFLALDKVLPRRDFLQVLDMNVAEVAQGAPSPPAGLAYDPEWLALLKRTHPLVSLTRYAHVPQNMYA